MTGRRWLLLALLLALAVALLLSPRLRLAPDRPPSTATMDPQALRAAAVPGLPASSPASTQELVAVLKRPEVPAAKAEDAVWDLCGIGRLPRPAGKQAGINDPWLNLPRHLGAEPAALAMEKLVTALDAGNPRQQAAAVMLRGSDAAGVEAPQALSKLAAASRDPVVARWLLQRCGAMKSCSEQDLRLWTELEPDNLAAWLDLVDRRPELKADLMSRAAGLSRFDIHESQLVAVTLQTMPPGTLPYVQTMVMTDVFGVEAAFSIPSPRPLTDHCRSLPEAGGDRQRVCAALGQVFMERSDSLMGYMFGLRLAELGGAPRGPLEAERKRINQNLAFAGGGVFDDDQIYSCRTYERNTAWLQLRLRLGERGALQALADAAAASAPR